MPHPVRTPIKIISACVMILVLLAACGNGQQPGGSGVGYVSGKQVTQVDSADRKTAPVISGPSVTGDKTISTDDFAGKVLVLNVWGSWCPPCRQEAPALNEASRETADVAQFIGINNLDPDPAPAQAFERTFEANYPSIYDPQGKELVKFAGTLPPKAIPSTLIIDTDGKIAVRILGPITKITLVDMINDVVAGQ